MSTHVSVRVLSLVLPDSIARHNYSAGARRWIQTDDLLISGLNSADTSEPNFRNSPFHELDVLMGVLLDFECPFSFIRLTELTELTELTRDSVRS